MASAAGCAALWRGQGIPPSHRRHSPLKRKHVIPGDMGRFGIQDKREMALHKRRMHIAAVIVSVGVCPQIVTPPRAGSPIVIDRPRDLRMALADEATIMIQALF